MELYELLLFAHVLGAVVLVGGSLIGPLLAHRLKKDASIAGLRAHVGVVYAISRSAGPSAGIVLLAGIGMVVGEWSFGDSWIAVSLALFALSGALALGVADPVLKRLVTAVQQAPDGPVPPEIQALVHNPKMDAVHNLLLPVDVAIVALMTTKPGFGVSVGLAVLALAAGAGMIATARRRPARAAAS